MKTLVAVCFLIMFTLPAAADDPLAGLTIAPETVVQTNTRSLYKHWTDEDHDGEDTRQKILKAESYVETTTNSNGKIVSGLWFGRYCGHITKDPSTLQIDHMIPLKEVHESGGSEWSSLRRRAYANDLDEADTLIAVKGGCNGSKRDRDPADWLPPNRSYWCEYLEDWVRVKLKWSLSVDPREATAIREGFRVCKKYKSGDKLEGRH